MLRYWTGAEWTEHLAPAVAPPGAAPPARADLGTAMLIPIGRSPWAIASGYLGLFSLLILPGPFAVLTGILALRDIHAHPEKLGAGRAVTGIVLGGMACLVLVWWLLAAVVGTAP